MTTPVLRLRRHGVVLARPLLRAAPVAAAGVFLAERGWPLSAAGAAGLALSALAVLRAVWRWERTLIVVTSDEVRLVRGTVRRRSRAVPRGAGPVDVEQGLLGRVLGYGTVLVGGLELSAVARPRELARLLARRPSEPEELRDERTAAAVR